MSNARFEISEAIEPINWADFSDSDSGYNEEQMSTASVTSSIFAYEEENGRTYHAYKSGKYVMPNDDGEQERMDIHYHAVRLTIGNKHWIAPVDEPRSIIDVGTGTGIWAMDVADDFPGSEVLGIDLSPIQPTVVPPNLQFVVQDLEEPWDMPGRFDFVHTRLMNGFSVKSWPNFYKNAFASMKPGGWVENQEFDLNFTTDDNSQPHDSAVRRWQDIWNEAVATVGMTGRCDPIKMADQMKAAGFINVAVRPFKMPLGPWPKNKILREAGIYNMVGMVNGLTGLSVRVYTQILGWSLDEMELLLMQVRTELLRKGIHCYLPLYVVYGQKPPAT